MSAPAVAWELECSLERYAELVAPAADIFTGREAPRYAARALVLCSDLSGHDVQALCRRYEFGSAELLRRVLVQSVVVESASDEAAAIAGDAGALSAPVDVAEFVPVWMHQHPVQAWVLLMLPFVDCMRAAESYGLDWYSARAFRTARDRIRGE